MMPASTTAVMETPAKLNLFLEIRGKRADGYHELDTVMMAIDWYDRLKVTLTRNDDVTLRCRWAGSREAIAEKMGIHSDAALLDLPQDSSNLVHQAISGFRRVFGIREGFDVQVEKNIPAGAGMGGASSDAAAVLLAAATLCGIPPNHSILIKLAAKIGSDVPFFLGTDHSDANASHSRQGYMAARATGTGTQLNALTTEHPLHAVVVFPGVSLATAEVYKHCLIPDAPRSADELIQVWQSDQPERVGGQFLNRLTVPAKKLAPIIDETLESLRRIAGDFCQLTGSGSACFAMTESREQAEAFALQLRSELGTLVRAVSGVSVPPHIEITEPH